MSYYYHNSSNDFSFSPFILGIILVIVLLFVDACVDSNVWNNGKCYCGGKYVYETAVGHRYSTNFIYHCDKCGHIVEVNYKR